MTASREPWWTDADQAELDCLLWELVTGHEEHRARHGCDPMRCPALGKANRVKRTQQEVDLVAPASADAGLWGSAIGPKKRENPANAGLSACS